MENLLPSLGFFLVTPMTSSRGSMTLLGMVTEEDLSSPPVTSGGRPIERGVSVDQDGKSNVWAIEPKESLVSRSNEEKTKSTLVAAAGVGITIIAAAAILTNLPDPSQF